MADPDERLPNNVPGPFYIDDSCIICGMCSELAPGVFTTDEDEVHNVVYRQPQTDEDRRQAIEAMDECPTESIGNDESKPATVVPVPR